MKFYFTVYVIFSLSLLLHCLLNTHLGFPDLLLPVEDAPEPIAETGSEIKHTCFETVVLLSSLLVFELLFPLSFHSSRSSHPKPPKELNLKKYSGN